MRANPLHPDPVMHPNPAAEHTVAFKRGEFGPPVPPRTDPRTAQRPTTGVSSIRAIGETRLPQATVDHRVAGEIKKRVADRLAQEIKASARMSPESQAQRGRALINEAVAVWSDAIAVERGASTTQAEDAALASAVYDMLFRAGRLQPYLDDERVENILINGYDEVWLDYGDSGRVRVAPVADSDEELQEMLRDLARRTGQSERTLSTADPFLALRLADGSRLQAVTGVTPKTFVTIRRHRVKDVDLDGMIQLGAIDETLAAFLAAAVRAEKNIMITGEQAVGKTSLLRALLKEIDPDERFATIETEFELFAHTNGFHRQVVPMESRESNGERGADGRGAGEITLLDLIHRALRMSLSRVVVGEVRGQEIVAMMQAMTNGKGGNLCTIHARRPEIVFDRIAELYLLAQDNMTEQLAYRQAANGLDFIVFVSMRDETRIEGKRHRFVSHVLEVTGMGENGRPATNRIFAPRPGEPRAVPHMHPSCLEDLVRVGFPVHLLDHPHGSWQRPLDLQVMAG
ncbi:CpaF family protein [Streptomyces sp. NPDC057521]|uniref:CpaF family protein n=1 Tax=Streptomyces sp. NPDC057521 TaxID=3346156 RepID=UPI0036AEA9AE